MNDVKLKWHIEQRKVSDLIPWDKNPHTMTDKERKNLSKSLDKFDYVEVVIINLDNRLIGGHQRLNDFKTKNKQDELIDVRVPNRLLDEKEFEELAIRLNKNRGHDDEALLKQFFESDDLKDWGFDEEELNNIFLADNEAILKQFDPVSLQEQFIIPPFSVLDTRQGYWQKRKQLWHSLGFDSQETREDIELIAQSGQSSAVYELRNKMRNELKREPSWNEIIEAAKKKGLHVYEGASVFDPVLAEVCYKWFTPDGGDILDPFAGGSVRGIVAGVCGFGYLGIDLREDQVTANQKQVKIIESIVGREISVYWKTGDSNVLLESIKGTYDFLFSCPPYHDLEKYSDDPADLSNMSYDDFIKVYKSIVAKSVAKLKDNRFACFVVGEIRDKQGFYKNFVRDTIECFESAGAKFYNEMILINVAGSLPIRVGQQFKSGRKVGKMHQNVLVFYKGDPKKIKEEFPEIKVGEYLDELNDNPNIALSVPS
jgi:hypothetical protein